MVYGGSPMGLDSLTFKLSILNLRGDKQDGKLGRESVQI